MKAHLSLFAAAFFLACGITLSSPDERKAQAAGSGVATPAASGQEDLEAKFKNTLTQATLSGRWCGIKEGALTPDKEEKYTIVGVTKLGGDNWLINARIQYGNRDIVAPIPAQVKWAGDTAVICVTNLAIPGGGTYTARVLIFGNTYAGSWSGQDHGGLLNGVITNGPK
jgi:hypothetical protein